MSEAPLPPLGAYFRALHPRVSAENHTVTSARDSAYNCIAYAVHDTETFWQPGGVEGTDWPVGIDDSDTVAAWEQFFGLNGFEACETGVLVEPGFVKIAIYALDGEPQHVARQLPSGRWTSKLGVLQDIEHDLEALEDSRYGSVAVVLRRAEP